MKQMISMTSFLVALLLFVSSATAFKCSTAAPSDSDPSGLTLGPTCTDIITYYPQAATPTPAEDMRIMCPYIRMMQRSGTITSSNSDSDAAFWTNIVGVSQAAKAFGCAHSSCGLVATAVGVAQKLTWSFDFALHALDLDARKLWGAKGVSHDCGLTFTLGEKTVNATARGETLQRLKELATPEGHLSYADLAQVKAEACARDYKIHSATGAKTLNSVDADRQTLKVASAGETELGLIYSYCGGIDQGYVTLSDVSRLLHAQMPERKSKFEVNKALIAAIDKN